MPDKGIYHGFSSKTPNFKHPCQENIPLHLSNSFHESIYNSAFTFPFFRLELSVECDLYNEALRSVDCVGYFSSKFVDL